MIGAWGSNLPGATPEGWQKPMTGSLDELRVFKRPLLMQKFLRYFS
ncbi:MAG: hypothetical protein IPP49_14245 [Saprospiraceae bacterium]|nr:hypothetical protein [Saprospiraceae bacterium]